MASPPGAFPVRPRTLIVLAVLTALGVVAAKLPGCIYRERRLEHMACLDRLDATGEGEAARCGLGSWFWIAELAPWSRGRSRRMRADVTFRVHGAALALAGRRDLDRAALERAGRALIAAAPASSGTDRAWVTTTRLLDAGAIALAIEHGAAARDAGTLRRTVAVALGRGDVETPRALATRAAEADDEDWAWPRARALAACLLGDRQVGVDVLEATARRLAHDDLGEAEVRAARRACAEPEPGLPDEGTALTRLLARQRDGTLVAELALADIAAPGLGLVAPRRDPLTAWDALGAAAAPDLPAVASAAAAALEQLAGAARPRTLPADWGEAGPTMREEAYEDPAPYLRWGAWALHVDAAVGWARRGDLPRAQQAATAAARLHRELRARWLDQRPGIPVPAARLTIAALHVAGDRAAALALAAEGRVGPDTERMADDPDVGRAAAIQHALLLAEDGQLAAALAVLEAPATSTRAGTSPQAETLRDAAAWLRAAIALRAGTPEVVATGLFELTSGAPAVAPTRTTGVARLASWWSIAQAAPASRPRTRWLTRGDAGSLWLDLQAVLPAALYLVGAVAADADVELWLDLVTATSGVEARVMMAARAEAARWRGDAEAAAAWTARLATLRATIDDERSAWLLDLLGG